MVALYTYECDLGDGWEDPDVHKDPKEAREKAEEFTSDKQRSMVEQSRVTLQDVFAKIQAGAVKELNVIVKADGQGSVEAMCQSLENLAHEEVRVKIVSRGVESDKIIQLCK